MNELKELLSIPKVRWVFIIGICTGSIIAMSFCLLLHVMLERRIILKVQETIKEVQAYKFQAEKFIDQNATNTVIKP